MRLARVYLLLSLLPGGAALHGAGPDYQREIKPLLEHKCYACHGGLKQKAGLRLDTVSNIRKGGRSGSAIKVGDPSGSLLIQRIRESNASKRMPQEAGALTSAEIALLENWIKAGALAPKREVEQTDPRKHWSYQPMRRPAVPHLPGPEAGNPIDAFLAARRQAAGHVVTAPAEQSVLLRRVHLDLIGLPPTPSELRQFLTDPSPEAYGRVVDQLLEDPRHGERWGRHWMDVWRYSDWYGRRGVNEIRYSMRHIWRWRDWIVRSVNADKGYDRMIVEMLAGDEVNPTDDGALAATGFVGRNWYKFDRNVWLFDTVERTSQGLLGLTMRCARCHDHKYDPITQEDYYRFRAFFEPHDVRTDPIDAAAETEKDNNKALVLKAGLSRVFDKEIEVPTYLFRRGDDRSPDKSNVLTPAVPVALTRKPIRITPVSLPPSAFYPALRPEILRDRMRLAEQGIAQARQAVVKLREEQAALTKRIAAIKRGDERLPQRSEKFLSDAFDEERPEVWNKLSGKWSYADGKLAESLVTSFATIVTKTNHPAAFRVKVRYRPLSPGVYRSVGFSFDFVDKGNSQDVYTSTGDSRQSVQAFHRTKGKNSYPRAGIVKTELKVGEVATIEAEARGQQLKIWLNGEEKLDYQMPILRQPGKFALWVHNGAAEFLDLEIIGLGNSLGDLERDSGGFARRIAAGEKAEEIARAELVGLKARVAAETAKHSGVSTNQVILRARSAARSEAQIRMLRAERELLLGGDSKKAGQELAAAKKSLAGESAEYAPLGETFPSTSTGRRLALANWIASPDNPRTARVAVNHIWLRHFGTALVPSVANFGPAGKEPTHPELLDWLATELVENGWSMKHLHRLIVRSAAYRRSSKPSSAGDHGNRFYTRMNSRRMEAEVVRDSILHLAGNLDQAMGGVDLDEKLGESSARRSLYFRATPDSQMELAAAFDGANPNACYEREVSVVPQQSLALFNGGLGLDKARRLAANLARECGGQKEHDGDFVRAAYGRILGRDPSGEETGVLLGFLAKQQSLLADPGVLKKFSRGGTSKIPPSGDPVQRARENLVHALFNHNEFITIR